VTTDFSAAACDNHAPQDNVKSACSEQNECDGELDKLTKQIAKGGGITAIGTVVGKISTLGLHILMSRVLGSAAYGLYVLGISIAGIAQAVA